MAHRLETVTPAGHLARLDKLFNLPDGFLANHDLALAAYDDRNGPTDPDKKIPYDVFVQRLARYLRDALNSPEPLEFKPDAATPPAWIGPDGIVCVCTMGRLGRLLASHNGVWYTRHCAAEYKIDAIVGGGKRSPLDVVTFVESSEWVTMEARSAKYGEFQSREPVDLDLPVYWLKFTAPSGEPGHMAFVEHGKITQSVWKKKRAFTTDLTSELRIAILDGNLVVLTGEQCAGRAIGVSQSVPSAQ